MAAASQRYRTLEIKAGSYWLILVALAALIGVGLLAAHYMEHHGHWVTGMTNQIVWGMPHVFAILLIVAASGALNVASLSSVFGNACYKPLSRLSGLIAVALLVGGLLILVLDLGRPDRLIVAMTTYNFKSIFAWNIFLYTGFVFIAIIYLWMLFEPRMARYSGRVGLVAFVWRIVLTTGTGSIFGFLVARTSYDAAIMAPLFVALSLSVGTALFMLIATTVLRMNAESIAGEWLGRLRRLNGIFVAVVLYFTLVQIIAGMYVAEHAEYVRFVLSGGGPITVLFWLVQIMIGGVLPLFLFLDPRFSGLRWTMAAALLVVAGAVAQLYVIIIGGQAVPMDLFPGQTESSTFFDGVAASYSPSGPELLLGIGGIGVSLFLIIAALRVLPFLPAGQALENSPR